MTEFQIEEISAEKRKVTLQLHPAHLALVPAGESQPYVFLRKDFFDKLELIPGMRVLMLKVPPKLSFKLEPSVLAELKQWLGVPSPAQLALLLKRRYFLSLPLAILFLIAALPLSGNEAAGIKPITANPFNFGMGLALLGLWVASKVRPHPILFLLDAGWFTVLALGQIPAIYRNGNWWWIIWVLLLLWVARSGWQRYRLFVPEKSNSTVTNEVVP